MKYLHGQILTHSLMALYWGALAMTGAAKTRQIAHGTTGPEFTDEEKIIDAMDTMYRHIHIVRDACENLPV